MAQKLIFFDIDGTILPETGEPIPKSTIEAIKLARANGHLTLINSGRTMTAIPDLIKDLGFDGYLCGCGTYLYYHDEVLYSHTIPHDLCVETVEFLRACNVPVFFEADKQLYIDGNSKATTPDFEMLEQFFHPQDIMKLSAKEKATYTFDKFLMMDKGESCNFKEALEFCKEHFDPIDRGCGFWEIIQKNHSKATAIKFFMEQFHVALEDCYAIGDSTNDLSMLEFVPNSIAMGNSDPRIFPYCSYKTTDILDNGIYNALKHFEII